MTETKSRPRVAAFLCENSALWAADISARRQQPDASFEFFRVPCAGKVDELYLMRALEEGVDGVIVLGCFEKSCRYLRGNVRAERRLARLRSLLEEIGFEPERVEFAQVTATQDRRLDELLNDFAANLKELPPNPGTARKAVR